jgi:hypothetical protein
VHAHATHLFNCAYTPENINKLEAQADSGLRFMSTRLLNIGGISKNVFHPEDRIDPGQKTSLPCPDGQVWLQGKESPIIMPIEWPGKSQY